MNFDSTNVLLKINVFFINKTFDVVNVKNECIKLDIKLDVAKFVMKKRFDFLLIEYKNDFDVMKREKDFHFRVNEKVML